MRFHRLVLRAIGPFPGQHEIDFDALSVSGLFLLNGPTGSGKSTLIDAIEFALYGARDEMKERMVSGHAAADVEPFVDLVFSNARGIFRVIRTPEYRRAKQRGSGTTKANATARLFRLAGEEQIGVPGAGEPVTANVAETGATVLELVQLTREQFTQTVVLPQGKFATFLTTAPEDRRKVLQDVFGTRIYELTQDRLREAAAQAGRTVGDQVQRVQSAAAHMWRCGLSDEPVTVTERTDLDDLALRAAALAEQATARHDEAAASLARARASADHAEEALRRAGGLAAALERRREALAGLAALDEEQEEIAGIMAVVARAEAAESVRPALAEHATAAAALATAAAALAQCVGQAAAGFPEDSATLTAGSGTAVEALRDRVVGDVARIEHALPAARELAGLVTRADATGEEIRALQGERGALTLRLEAIPAARQRLLGERSGLETVAAGRGSAAIELERAAQRLAAAQDLERTGAELARAQSNLATAATACHSAREVESAAHEAWVNALAGELAAELRDGLPCPVCGSAAHPLPATRTEDAPSRAEVQAARAAADGADEELTRCRAALVALETRVEGLRSRLEGRGAAAVAAEHAVALATLAEATRADARLKHVARELEAAAAQEKELAAAAADLDARTADRRVAVAALDSGIAAARAAVDTARGTFPSVGAALTHMRAQVALLDEVRAARGRHQEAVDRLASADRQLDQLCAHVGFAAADDARTAQLPAARLAALRTRVAAHTDARAAHSARLAEPEIAALTGAEEPRLAAHAEEASAARADLQRAAGAEGSARHVAGQCADALGSLTAEIAEFREATREAAPILHMAAVATGENTRNTTLASYVLLRRFDEVLAAANRRLGTMSDGRYELVRSEDREAGTRNRRQGLALEVRDHDIGRARSPHSLSGGETFYTSLALALGLADIVTDEAGGVELGTLFVDEGFGSLDQDVLGNVMGVLHSLTGDGRAVGIVSHVGELKSQIAEQVEVRRLPGGGSTLVVRA